MPAPEGALRATPILLPTNRLRGGLKRTPSTQSAFSWRDESGPQVPVPRFARSDAPPIRRGLGRRRASPVWFDSAANTLSAGSTTADAGGRRSARLVGRNVSLPLLESSCAPAPHLRAVTAEPGQSIPPIRGRRGDCTLRAIRRVGVLYRNVRIPLRAGDPDRRRLEVFFHGSAPPEEAAKRRIGDRGWASQFSVRLAVMPSHCKCGSCGAYFALVRARIAAESPPCCRVSSDNRDLRKVTANRSP